MTKLLNKIDINPLVWIILLAGYLTGYIKYIILVFIIIFIHEMGHIIIALILKRKIKKICILPFGGYILIDSLISSNIIEDLFISLGGVLFQGVLGGILIFLYKYNYINSHIFIFLNSYNIIIILFNLVPISPLDGAKILRLFLEIFIPFKKVFLIILLISIISIFITIIFNLRIILDNIFVFIFLIFTSIKEFKDKEYILNRFYLERITHEFNYPYLNIKQISSMYKNKRHYIDGLEEKEYLLKNVYKT